MEVGQGPGRGAEQNSFQQPGDKPSGKELLVLEVGSQEMAKLMGHGKGVTATRGLCH